MLKLFKLEKGWIFIANVRDITERKKAEERSWKAGPLSRSSTELRDMLTIASHELRHPATIFKATPTSCLRTPTTSVQRSQGMHSGA